MAERFSSKIEIFGIEPPTTKASLEAWHDTQPGFGVRIAKARKDGKVRRTYLARGPYKLLPDGSYADDKVTLGLVDDIGTGDVVLSYQDAQAEAMRRLRDSKILRAGGTVRLTVGRAYEKLEEGLTSANTLDSPAYAKRLRSLYDRFLSHLSKRNLDELKEGFWLDYYRMLRDGTLNVGTLVDKETGKSYPDLRKASSANYALAVLNAASRLYKLGHEYHGIEGEAAGWDPTRAAVKKIEAPNARDTFLKFEDISRAWAATDALMAPWWRDLWRVYLLTGLRDKLVMEMRFDQIDFERGLYLIDPLRHGAKRQRRKLSQVDRTKFIELPLSTYVLEILRRRKQYAPTGPAGELVWYSIESTHRTKNQELPRLVDPRATWKRLVPVLGYWVYKHDLRRTFASIGATVDQKSILALSLLLLHSSRSISIALGVPTITVEYIKGQQRAMKATAERITKAVLELAGEVPRTELTQGMLGYGELPAMIENSLRIEEAGVQVVPIGATDE